MDSPLVCFVIFICCRHSLRQLQAPSVGVLSGWLRRRQADWTFKCPRPHHYTAMSAESTLMNIDSAVSTGATVLDFMRLTLHYLNINRFVLNNNYGCFYEKHCVLIISYIHHIPWNLVFYVKYSRTLKTNILLTVLYKIMSGSCNCLIGSFFQLLTLNV